MDSSNMTVTLRVSRLNDVLYSDLEIWTLVENKPREQLSVTSVRFKPHPSNKERHSHTRLSVSDGNILELMRTSSISFS